MGRRSLGLAFLMFCLSSVACGGGGGSNGDDDSSKPPDAAMMEPDGAPGNTPDATPGTPDAAPVLSDAAVGVKCGSMSCSSSQECCVKGLGQPDASITAMCIDKGGVCTGGAAVHCDGPEDCGGNACCGSIIGGANTSCSTQKTCQGGLGTFTICHQDSECGGTKCCTAGTTGVCAKDIGGKCM
jgi:hypothetical protein